jgi:hypothetical protein
MVFNATFNNISVISWRSVFLVKETELFIENHQPAADHWQTLSHNIVSRTPLLNGIRTHNFSGDRHWMQKVGVNPTTMGSRPVLKILFIYLYYALCTYILFIYC